MLRFILLLFAIALAFGGMWRMLAPGRRTNARTGVPARMVRCAHCDLYVPEEDATRSGDQYYCGEDHRLLGPRAGSR